MAALTSSQRIIKYSKVLSKHCRKQAVLTLSLTGFGLLLIMFQLIAFRGLGSDYDFYIFGRGFILAAAFSGVLTVPAVFRELYNRQFADVEFSLPMSAAERFKAKLLVMLRHHILPVTAALVIMIPSVIIFCPPDEVGMLIPDLLRLLLYMLFTDAVCLFCVSCCGSLVECIYTPVFMAFALSQFLPLTVLKLLVALSGRRYSGHEYYNLVIGYPRLLWKNIDDRESYFAPASGTEIAMMIFSVVFTVLLILLAYHCYRKRSGLSVGKPFAYKAFYRFFVISVTVTVILLFFMANFYNAIFIGLLICLGIFISSQRRSITLHTMMNGCLCFMGCIAVVLVIGFVSFLTGGFGYKHLSPSQLYGNRNSTVRIEFFDNHKNYTLTLYPQNYPDYPAIHDHPEDYAFATDENIRTAYEEVVALDDISELSFIDKVKKYADIIKYENYAENSNTVRFQGYVGVDGTLDYYYGHDDISYTYTTECTLEKTIEFAKKLVEKVGGRFEVMGWGDYDLGFESVLPDELLTESTKINREEEKEREERMLNNMGQGPNDVPYYDEDMEEDSSYNEYEV
ncbi:MAG: hypothetical protein IKP95_04115 [Ruminococcus sp.]|nr:hypothetical protein [Ruminococcus sp.]